MADAPGVTGVARRSRSRQRALGPRGLDRLLPAGSHRRHHEGDDRGRMAAPVRSRRLAPGHPRPARADAVQRRGRLQADRRALGRRDGAAAVLPDHAAEAERARARRADQPPRSRIDQRAERRAAEVRGHGPARHPRPGPDRGSRHPRSGTSTAATIRDFKGSYEEYEATLV